MNRKDLVAIMRAALLTPLGDGTWGLPLMVRGEPGTAKTALLSEVAHSMGMWLYVFIGSLRDPTDILGLPTLARYEKGSKREGQVVAKNADTRWVHQANDAPNGALIFMDEVSTCPASVQAALLRVINERYVGDTQLASHVRIIAAMNEVQDAAGGTDLAPPMANRFGHLTWEGPTATEWCAWMLDNAPAVEPIKDLRAYEAKILEGWPTALSQAKVHVSSFIRAHSTLLHQKPKQGTEEIGAAWPSYRTWTLAAYALASARVHGLTEDQTDAFVQAYVGKEPAGEFATWLRNANLPNPLEVLDGKVDWKYDPVRLDIAYAVMASCTQAVLQEEMPDELRTARARRLFIILGEILDVSADTVVDLGSKLEQAGLIPEDEEMNIVLEKLFEAMQAAETVAA